MINLEINYTGIKKEILKSQEIISKVHNLLWEKKGIGNEMLGWLDWPINFDKNEIMNINKKADSLKKSGIDTLLVIGIGGSYLGSKAGINFLKGSLNFDDKIYFAGINVSDSYMEQLEKKLENKNWAICVISKSGTTLEPALSFRHFKSLLEKKVGKEKSKELIVAVTDGKSGVLRNLAEKEGFQRFVIPNNIGGRFSVITAVGLFPMAFVGIDILKILDGTKEARNDLQKEDISKNLAYQYAIGRFLLYKDYGKEIEIFTTYDPDLIDIGEWWKQLFAESEGKDGKSLFPVSVNNSRDLHSLGQVIQEGKKIFFETTLFNKEDKKFYLKKDKDDLDKLNYLTDKSFAEINGIVFKAVLKAHNEEAKIPNFIFTFDKVDEKLLGYLWFFFFISVAVSGYLLEINPFDQPGVEGYKNNMFNSLK